MQRAWAFKIKMKFKKVDKLNINHNDYGQFLWERCCEYV